MSILALAPRPKKEAIASLVVDTSGATLAGLAGLIFSASLLAARPASGKIGGGGKVGGGGAGGEGKGEAWAVGWGEQAEKPSNFAQRQRACRFEVEKSRGTTRTPRHQHLTIANDRHTTVVMSLSRGAQSYRTILRAATSAFRGDETALRASVVEARSHFEKNRHVSDPREVENLCAEADDAARFLLETVVQATAPEGSTTYELGLDERHTGGGGAIQNEDGETTVQMQVLTSTEGEPLIEAPEPSTLATWGCENSKDK